MPEDTESKVRDRVVRRGMIKVGAHGSRLKVGAFINFQYVFHVLQMLSSATCGVSVCSKAKRLSVQRCVSVQEEALTLSCCKVACAHQMRYLHLLMFVYLCVCKPVCESTFVCGVSLHFTFEPFIYSWPCLSKEYCAQVKRDT